MELTAGHLTYCTNIYPGESWADHFDALKESFPSVKERFSGGRRMGIGLRLSNQASLDLLNGDHLSLFKSWLAENDAYVFTMNGFPYGDFHHAVVKDKVHSPDWTTSARVEYTIRLFHILAKLIPPGLEGGISTSPLSYRHWFTEQDLPDVTQVATRNILLVAETLFRIKKLNGISMHLDIEPEPDGILETGAEFIAWYEDVLLPLARQELAVRLDIPAKEAEECVREHIRLCYDVCHFAIGYEQHRHVLDELAGKKIGVGKIQVSAALKADLPSGQAREALASALSGFNEPVYLHQVVARNSDGSLSRYRDLPEALRDIENPLVNEWRTHFHVPVFTRDMGLLKSTQQDIEEVLSIQKEEPFTAHLEVETYTWEVLPDMLRIPLDLSVSRELNWVKNFLEQ